MKSGHSWISGTPVSLNEMSRSQRVVSRGERGFDLHFTRTSVAAMLRTHQMRAKGRRRKCIGPELQQQRW